MNALSCLRTLEFEESFDDCPAYYGPSPSGVASKGSSTEQEEARSIGSTGEANSPERAGREQKLFPWTLYRMLEEAEQENNRDIIGWHPDGLSFKVHRRDAFTREILKRYFKNQTTFRSFQRQVRPDRLVSDARHEQILFS